MSYTKDDWKKRIYERIDLSGSLVHLTKDSDDENYMDILLKILVEKELIGSSTESGYICGDRKAVCFFDAPLYSICQTTYYEQKLWKEGGEIGKRRYLGFGLAFTKDYMFSKGARPVIYEKKAVAKRFLPRDEWWRIVGFDLSDENNYIDWTHEREWRIPENFKFELSEATLLCMNNSIVRIIAEEYENRTGDKLLSLLRGVVTLKDVFY